MRTIGATSSPLGTVFAVGVGAAAAMYFLDPQSGRRRRALLADQVEHCSLSAGRFLAKANRDALHRAQGVYRESVNRVLPRTGDVDEAKLEQRVRAALGRLSSHPHAIHVTCKDRTARLSGDILERELGRVLQGVARVQGIRDVSHELRVYERPNGIPALQGNSARAPYRFEFLQDNWAPAPRLLAGTAGLALLAAGLARGNLTGAALTTAGAVALLRSLANRPLRNLVSNSAAPEDGVAVQKTIHVHAEPQEAYTAWRDLERFPHFMSHVREVAKIGENQYRWTVTGPANVPVSWVSEVTADVPGELIAWRTVPGAPVQSSGIVHFETTSSGGTRIHVRMSYRPPINVVGQTLAKIFGRDPKHQMDDDLMRFKSYLETGTVRGAEAALRH